MMNDKIYKRYLDQAKKDFELEKDMNEFIKKEGVSYRKWYSQSKAKTKAKKKTPPITILAEGDSWFRYPVSSRDPRSKPGGGVINSLKRILGTKIHNLAKHGDEAHEMLTGEQRDLLKDALERGPDSDSNEKHYDYLLFSGGGNDLVGKKTFYKWINNHRKGEEMEACAGNYLNKHTIKCAFCILEAPYKELFKIRDTYSPETHILLNAYDFAIPDGRNICHKGPWLKPGLDTRKVPNNDLELRSDIVELFLKRFHDKFLCEVTKLTKNGVTVVPTQGAIAKKFKDHKEYRKNYKKYWANELHPNPKGFYVIAEEFAKIINGDKTGTANPK